MYADRVTITALEAENVKRIRAVQITPAPTGLTVLGGNNNQGKTSVLDAIAWALGGEKYRPDSAKRDGSFADPHLKVTLSNGVVVERKGKKSALTVTDPSGRRSGQRLLDAFVEPLAIDLPRFLEATDRQKAETLLRIIGVGDRLAELDHQIKALYERRTTIGQIAAQKKGFAEEMPAYPDIPEAPVSAVELIQQQQAILQRNATRAAALQRRDALAQREQLLCRRLEELRAQLSATERDLADVRGEIALQNEAELPPEESTAALESMLADIEATNLKVQANANKARALEEANALMQQYGALSAEIEALRTERTALLDGADLPLPGLGVEDGRLTYHGKNWGDMSGSDQLRVATAIVRRLNPACGFVLLDKLEQMDLATLREFGAWLQEQGLQAIATRVSQGDECQIIIEDGCVANAPASDPPTPDWMKGAF